MFIREIKKKNPGYEQKFVYHRLVESVRTPHGPRQRTLLNLGTLDIETNEWKTLANRIEEIFTGQNTFHKPSEQIEELAQYFADLLRKKEIDSAPIEQEGQSDWENVDLNSLTTGECRTIGGEAIALAAVNELKLSQILKSLGFNQDQIYKALLLIIGRLLHPASERRTALWGKDISALGELLGTDFHHLSNNALYRISDLLIDHQAEIETNLAKQSKNLFQLSEKIVLYDLTNTYLEGPGLESEKAQHGRSKEKRTDCPLVTLALVLDEDGFPKQSRIFPGNISEPKTLKEILQTICSNGSPRGALFIEKPTVVIDAGLATKENIELIKNMGFHYVCVARSRPKEIPQEGLIVIKEDEKSTIRVKKLTENEEIILYCQSSGRTKKEEAIKARMQKRFEEALANIAASLKKPKGRKGYDQIMIRLGRLQEKYPTLSQFYHVEVKQTDGITTSITWSIKNQEGLKSRFSGAYYIRSDREDLNEKELWSLYIMLTNVEDAFRSMKSDLGLRPIYHRKDQRIEGHLFITVLAYHLLALIYKKLKNKGIQYRWSTIRTRMATQNRVTSSLTNDQGQRIHIRQTTDPEPFHTQIYQALGLPLNPMGRKKVKT